MCGIVGFLDGRGLASDAESVVRRMARQLTHRGPDDEGAWFDAEAGIALGHRRLSIVDLSAHGHQPMGSASGRYMLVFNGEIYNYSALRRELEQSGGMNLWRGRSDTEVLLAAVERWGFRRTLARLNGMFAFALWDRKMRVLRLARDRFGEKPIYYGWFKDTFLFGSEIKALRVHPAWSAQIDRSVLPLFLRRGYVPTPHSIFVELKKLGPAHFLEVFIDGSGAIQGVSPECYWTGVSTSEQEGPCFPRRSAELLDELDVLLRDAIRLRMDADVPLGAFLSGGVDSSTVVALMQLQSARPVKTFTIGFHSNGYNEAEHAKLVAQRLETDHSELYVRPEDAQAVIPDLPAIYDEPFADSSQIPTYLVSRFARERVTVALSGDGGDEIFGGYNRHVWATFFSPMTERVPRFVRRAGAAAIQQVPPGRWDSFYRAVERLLPTPLKLQQPGDKLHKIATVLAADSAEEIYRTLTSHWNTPSSVLLDHREQVLEADGGGLPAKADPALAFMLLDAKSYLPDDILTKVDRASMAVSLEVRVPFLDHRLAEFSWRLPPEMRVQNGLGKWALRQVLHRYVPEDVVSRPKAGFGIPLGSWLRGPLRDWAEALLSERRMRVEGFFRSEVVQQRWHYHLTGRANYAYQLWTILMFQAWLEVNTQPLRDAV